MDRLEEWHVLMHSLAILRAVDESLEGVIVGGDRTDEGLLSTIHADVDRLIERVDLRVRARLAELREVEPQSPPARMAGSS